MAIRRSRDSFFSSQPSRQRRRRALRQAMRRELHLETLEDRRVMAGPQLVGIQPNEGDVLQNGTVLNIAPRSITFRFDEGQQIDPASLNGIRITQSGFDGIFGNANDIIVTPGFIGIGDNPNEVITRFLTTLPDDAYRIDIFGTGTTPLRNIGGEVFNNGVNRTVNFELDLGAQVVAIVPQPVRRINDTPSNPFGTLVQDRDKIVVYFNNDDLLDNATSAENPAFYQLIFTNDTVTNADDVVHLPTSVAYDAATDTATLTFSGDLATLSGAGTYRLRIGTAETLPQAPLRPAVGADPGSSFATAKPLGTLTSQSQILSAAIDPQFFPLQLPGSNDEPGHRDIPVMGENHLGGGDGGSGTPTISYNFRDIYGSDPQGNPLHNLITETQKQRARDIFALYGYYAGIQFQETLSSGLTIATGDLRAVDPEITTGPGGIAGIAGLGLAVMDAAELWDDNLGANWTIVAMHEIGHLLGLDHSYDLPAPNIMGSGESGTDPVGGEGSLPGDADVVHIQHLFRPDSTDIDLYQFTLNTIGQFTAETFAERLTTTNSLDTVITLYRQTAAGSFEQIARNDDYFSEDSFIDLQLGPGTYYIAVTSHGNVNFDPTILDSGFGGTSQGAYDLRLNFRPEVNTTIVDATGVAFDGDNDGRPGGVHDFWFRTQTAARTLVVDKIAPNGGTGSLAAPFNKISQAFAAALPGDVIRIVGNKGADGNLNTLGDNRAYEIGFGALNAALADGNSMRVPKGVTVMIDAGAVFKLKKAAIEVGSSSATVDLSQSALQVLGTPTANVVFTSYDDETIGVDTNPLVTTPVAGNWGGLLFRNDIDRAAGRFDYEARGIFLNYVNNADMRYGGGSVVISSVSQVVSPVQMIDARPTISFNKITKSADAAISANPNSFEETTFHAPIYQTAAGFTLDYGRIGPAVYGNSLLNNTTNALFVRIRTPAGNTLQEMTVSGRFDDTDIVHVISENLVINGSPGGSLQNPLTGLQEARLDARLLIDPGTIVKLDGSRIEVEFGAQLIAEGRDGQEVIFTSLFDDRYGASGTFDTSNNGSTRVAAAGNWGGLYVGHTSSANIDHAYIAYAGGITRLEGTFAAFNPVEIHQADARIAHTTFEFNATGTGGQAPANRFGKQPNGSATIFVRQAQPTISENVFRNNAAAPISINVNALNHLSVVDLGRTTGPIDLIPGYADNSGPLVRQNRLINNAINGMVVRGGTLTTQSVWDDTDIVHVVFDEIASPDFHTYGGLRLQSSATASLVVKLEGANAGFTSNGRPLDIDDRIGGTLHIIGQPGFPVVLTSLKDDSVGALFVNDTNNDGASTGGGGGGGLLPTGPEVDNGLLIDNDVAPSVVGHFEVRPGSGGAIGVSISGSSSGVTVQGVTQTFINEDYIFDFLNYIDTGSNGGAIDLASSTITQQPTLVSPDLVRSAGTFTGPNGPINWVVDTYLNNGESKVYNKITFTSANPFGNVRYINYLDEDVQGISDDVLKTVGTPGQADFRAFTIDGPEQVGFSHGGIYQAGSQLVNATYQGWAADQYPELKSIIAGAGTTYSINGNVDLTDLPPNNHPVLGAVNGPNDVTTAFAWALSPTATTATITTFLELIVQGGQTTPGGEAGDWRSIRIDEYSNDRNVDIVNELEPLDAAAPGTNAEPDTAQFLGLLAPNEKSGDDNRRLGFEIHGLLNKPADVDVYSFTADAGTEVWFDVDRTTFALDTVVELIDAVGQVIARSDNSFLEAQNPALLVGSAMLMQKLSGFQGRDFWTSNPKDAGMRVVLPGSLGTTNTYHVRVRSSSPDLDGNLLGGLTSGQYQLQIRLREVDEIPGSTVRNADIRYATNGIEVLGVPGHSPLLGEDAEIAVPNDLRANAQQIGNILQSDRAAVSVAGNLSSTTDVDWYEFNVRYANLQGTNEEELFAGMIFDIDYADGLARANTVISVFDANGNLVLTSRDSDITDDRPAPFGGSGISDLDRGSPGALDPFIGTVEMPEATFYIAVTSSNQGARELDQFTTRLASNPLLRLEPINSLTRIVEDHITSSVFTTAEPPQQISILDNSSVVPFHLGDVTLYVSRDVGQNDTAIATVDPFTGKQETFLDPFNGPGRFARDIRDIGMRYNGQLFGFSVDLDDAFASDAESGNYLRIDTGNATATNLGDDGIQTYEQDPADATLAVRSNNINGTPVGDGIQFEAIAYGILGQIHRGFAVGNRPAGSNPLGIDVTQNILYQFDPNTGAAFSGPQNDRAGAQLLNGAGTNIVERGELLTNIDFVSTTQNALLSPEATDFVAPNTNRLITDGMTLTVGDGVGPNTIFEFNSGPEVLINWDPANGVFVRDGDTFTLDGQIYEFNTGSVFSVNAANGSFIFDGETFTIFNAANGSRTYEFDDGTGGPIGAGNVVVSFTAGDTQADIVNKMVTAINNTPNFNVIASGQGSRVSLTGDSATMAAVSNAVNITVQGGPGVANPGAIAIPIEETSTLGQFQTTLLTTFNGPVIRASVDGARMNFSGAIVGNFAPIALRGVFQDMGTNGNVTPGRIGINFLAADSSIDIATRIQTALNAAGIANARDNQVVTLTGSGFRFINAPGSFTVAGSAPGGTITGTAFIGTQLYGVTDTGGLFLITNPLSGASTDYIEQSALDLGGLDFQALAAGPTNVEGGAYSQMLFGITDDGELFAFNALGQLQGIFVDGATSIDTGLSNVHGLAFSNLDYNLWHTTGNRGSEAGHGVNTDFHDSRLGSEGGTSLYFGFESQAANGIPVDPLLVPGNNFDYNFAGGAHGSMESRPFSLEGYSSTDQPVLYYNYRLETEDAVYNPDFMYDAFRVFARSDDNGTWTLLTTNNQYRGPEDDDDEFDYTTNPVQETFDAVNGWRQARIDLSAFAGHDNVRLRFDFSTAGSMDVGDSTSTGGSELRAIAGHKLRDGDTFSIDSTNFVFDMGFTLVPPAGASIADGEQFTIDGVVFEFNLSGGVGGGAIAVNITAGMAAAEVAQAMFNAISIPGVTPHLNDNRLNLEGATTVTRSAGAATLLEGAPGVGAGNVPVVIHSGMTEVEVAAAMRQAIADVFAGGNLLAIKSNNELVRIIGHDVTSAGPLGLTDELEGDEFGNFYNERRGQANGFEGVYIDDIIVGFAGRGEMATGAAGMGEMVAVGAPETDITVGPYQLEIRRAAEYGIGTPPDFAPPALTLTRSFDIRDRLAAATTLVVDNGANMPERAQFTLTNGINQITFEFNKSGAVPTPGTTSIVFSPAFTAEQMAAAVTAALNQSAVRSLLGISASRSGDRVDVAGGVSLATNSLAAGRITATYFDEIGDRNRFRDQGQILIQSNRISNSLQYGIVADAGALDGDGSASPHAGVPRNTQELNSARWVPGVTITNNIIYGSTQGGINISGEGDLTQPAAVPFARVINNTLYDPTGAAIGINVNQNASPTLLNNIIANFATGIQIDATSGSTVVGGTLYRGNGIASTGTTGDFPLFLSATDPLFVDESTGNFYLVEFSNAIDSSIDSLTDRNDQIRVKNPLGLGLSPILAPDRDGIGQLRIDDPAVSPPSGLGNNVFKDRGAIDRVDNQGPTAILVNPADNDAAGVDLDLTETSVLIPGNVILSDFSIQFVDGLSADETQNGVGIDHSSVMAGAITVTRDGATLVQGLDYTFSYDQTSSTIRLTPLAGIWLPNSTYVVTINNQPGSGIRDLANNALLPNQLSGETQFTIQIGNVELDFGDAPDPTFPTLVASNGPRHIVGTLFLGASVNSEMNGQPSAGANLDTSDNGIVFSSLTPGLGATITATASEDGGFLDAWIDFNRDGDWNDAGEHIFASEPLVAGANALNITIPAGASLGQTYARFRISTTGGLLTTGLASTGEVEDYQVTVAALQIDFGDAPAPYPTLLANDGARHTVGSLFLGASVDAEADGFPSATANGDDTNGTDDENGVVFNTPLKLNTTSTITVTASQAGFLDAWIDYNDDGDWNDAGERVFNARAVVAGANVINLPAIPVTAVRNDPTFMRFRLSTTGGLLPTGLASNGEVEDYQVTITGNPWQNGNPPLDGNGFGVDVNGDGLVTPTDILLVDSELKNRVYSDPVTGNLPATPVNPPAPPPYFDVNGDGKVTASDVLAVVAAFNLVVNPIVHPLTAGGSGSGTQLAALSAPSTTTSAPATSSAPAPTATPLAVTSTAATSTASTSTAAAPTAAVVATPLKTAQPLASTAASTASTTSSQSTASFLGAYNPTQVVSAQATTSTTKANANTAPVATQYVVAGSAPAAAVQLVEAALLEDELDDLVDMIADDVDEAWQSESAHDQVFALIE